VADVIEAMSSNRPYRPALGIKLALEEICLNKGKLYDADVVDASLEYFATSSYQEY
jgi:HD-GYP domain-containing protein (c-di-GMP phosphodiesterase class II)